MIKKIIIDTNIWLSYLMTDNFNNLKDIITSKKYEQIYQISYWKN